MSELKIESVEALHFYFNEAYSADDLSPIHIFVAFSKFPISEIPEHAASRDRAFKYKKVNDDFYSIELRIKKREVEGWLVTKENIWFFYTTSGYASTIAAEVAETWIKGMFPFISLGRISPTNIFEILDVLADSSKKLRINDYLSKQFQKSRWASQKNWSGREDYVRREMEGKISDDGNILDSVRLEFVDEDRYFKAGFSKNGHLTYYSGAKRGFTTFYRLLLDTYADKAVSRLNSLSQKEVKVSKSGENMVFPIKFEPKHGTLSLASFEKLISALKEQPDYSVSVVHKGNPWLSISIVDRSDGSNTTIYGFDDKLELIPMLKASPESLTRLEDLVFEVFTNVTKLLV